MKARRSLPPDLQALIDKFNSLLEQYDYRKMTPEERASYGDSDTYQVNFSGPWKEAGFDEKEWDRRSKEMLDTYNSILKMAKEYEDRGEVEVGDIPPRFGYDGNNSYYNYSIVPYTAEDNKVYSRYMHGVQGYLPSIKDTGKAALEPMRARKVERLPVERPGLQKSTPINIPQVEKELIMRTNPRMRTGQEPNYYIIKDGERNRVRPVESEELQYYRGKNRIR